MKKLTIAFSLLILSGTIVQAQDLKKAKNAYTLTLLPNSKPEVLENAKTEVDKLMADPKTSGLVESQLLKMEVYAKISGDSALAAKYPGIDVQAFDALKKYLQMEPSEEKLKADGYQGINEIYNAFLQKGLKHYRAEDWEQSFNSFKLTAEMGDMLVARKWSTSTFDTTSYLYAAATAQNSKKDAEAVKYYEGLANIKISGDDYLGVYDYLTKYYLTAKNKEQFEKYITLAKELYPSNPVWGKLEIAYMEDNSSLAEKFKKYDDAQAGGKLTSDDYITFGDMFTTSQKSDEKLDSTQIATIRAKAVDAYQKSYALDSSNGLVPFTIGTILFQNFQDLDDRYRSNAGTAPALRAKRAEIDKLSDEVATQALTWLEKGYRGLKAKQDRTRNETSFLNRSVDVIATLYAWKRDKAKGKNPKDVDLYDAQYQIYDKEHGIYK